MIYGPSFQELHDMQEYILKLHFKIHIAVRNMIKEQKSQYNSDIITEGYGDVSYAVDSKSETIIDKYFTDNPPKGGAVVICEGLGVRIYPETKTKETALWRILIDPLDGTRHIMYDNRSAWILTGVAPNKGEGTSLKDIIVALQTEVPISIQEKSIVLTAIKNHGTDCSIWNIEKNICLEKDLLLQPSSSRQLDNGFVVFTNFFPGTKQIISLLEENVLNRIVGEPDEGSPLIFSEQYISNAGQLFMLMTGRYRVCIDIRADLIYMQKRMNKHLPLCPHPYDLSAALIAQEAGIILLDSKGMTIDYPMDLNTNCCWIGYANQGLFDLMHPVLVEEMKCMEII